MSRVCWWDCSVGAAGDMLLAALVDAGASADRVRDGLARLDVDGWELAFDEVHRGAFRALRARVTVDGESPDAGAGPVEHGHDVGHLHEHGHHHGHDHGHDHDHGHAHDHDHDHDHDHGHHHHDHDHVHRPWREVRALIAGADLPERARRRALTAYERLARAEAHLHGMDVEDVALHEVGSVDAIVDIVGVCLALEDLGVDRVVATPLPMGTGVVRAAHGDIPLPAPATLEVLAGWPVVPSRWPGEWVTPTGAALVAGLAEPGPFPAMTLEATGHGAGGRDPSFVANLVRAVVGREGAERRADEVVELACNVDDLTGELVAPVVQRLLDAGALDAWVVPVHMKKGRPGLVVQALAPPHLSDALSDLLLRHTSTLGVRRRTHERRVLDRWFDVVETPYGPVRVKVGGRDGVPWHAAPEHDDVAARAAAADVPQHEVHRLALSRWSDTRP